MSKPTLLIADTNQRYAAVCSQYFQSQGFEVFQPVDNGIDAVAVVEANHVDVLLLDLVLHRIDGFAVIQSIHSKPNVHQPMMIVHTALSSEQMISAALRQEVRYFFLKMTGWEIIHRRVVDLLAMEQSLEAPVERGGVLAFSGENVRETVSQLIRSVGVPVHIKGYHHLRAGIECLIAHRDHADDKKYYGMTTHVYPEIAEKFNTSPQRVERNIRNAIEIAWNRGNLETLREIFGYGLNDKKCRPTNSEFIAMLADRAIMMLSGG